MEVMFFGLAQMHRLPVEKEARQKSRLCPWKAVEVAYPMVPWLERVSQVPARGRKALDQRPIRRTEDDRWPGL